MELIDEHNYRYITENIKFNIIVTATSNPECNNENNPSEILLKPTPVSTARIENYKVETLTVNSTYTNLVTSSDIETSIVEPGSIGNIMMLYLEPTYANVVSAKLKTGSLYVPSLGKDVQMQFKQLVYNEEKGAWTTLYGAKDQVDDTLDIELVSKIDENGNSVYTGVIFIHVQLEKFAGLEDTIKATLEVETNNGKMVTRYRNLLTTYLPGTQMIYDKNKQVADNNYLIQKGTSENELKIKIYGYQFNSNPVITFNWELPHLKDGNGNLILDDNKNILIGDDPNRYVIHYENLLFIINDLRNAGAEAISINGQRIVVSSEIRCVGNVILINTTRLAPPFEISAIGNPTTLAEAIEYSSTYQQLQLSGFPVSCKATDIHSTNIKVPAYTGSFSTKALSREQSLDLEEGA